MDKSPVSLLILFKELNTVFAEQNQNMIYLLIAVH